MKKLYWIESTKKLPNLHKEAVQCSVRFSKLSMFFCGINLNIAIFVSIEFYDNQHENSHTVRGCGACLGIRAWRRLLWMVCYTINEKSNWTLKFKINAFCCFTSNYNFEILKILMKMRKKKDKIPWQGGEIINGWCKRSSWTKHTLKAKQMEVSMSQNCQEKARNC